MRTQMLEDDYLFVVEDEEETQDVAEYPEDGFNIWQLLLPLNA